MTTQKKNIYKKSEIPEELEEYFEPAEFGLEETPEEYVKKLADGFDELKRVLRDDGTFWLNLGDSYAKNKVSTGGYSEKSTLQGYTSEQTKGRKMQKQENQKRLDHGLKQKDLVGIPWRVALELQSRGWYLRNDIIWNKPNPMPESVNDRCTTSHEHIFLLTKSKQYYYDQDAIREPLKQESLERWNGEVEESDQKRNQEGINPGGVNTIHQIKSGDILNKDGANKRDVWDITVSSLSDAHFAVFPPELPETCIKAGTDEGDTVIDPFCGAGTTGLVANRLNRDFIGIELNEKYCEMSRKRIKSDMPLFTEETN